MTLNHDNDVYQGNLVTLNEKKQAWVRAYTGYAKYSWSKWIVLLAGFACVIFVLTRTKSGDESVLSQLPLHLSIWATALAVFLVARRGKKSAEQPFDGFHLARFETDDDTLYYVFQKGMTYRTYYIHDDDIVRIYRDDDAGVLLIEGDATVNIRRRRGETEDKVTDFFALVPFDKYDLDDLLKPYRKKVIYINGKLRSKYTEEYHH